MSFAQKRLISFFKSFVDKVFAPQFSKINSNSEKQWNKFSSLLSMDAINYAEVQLYVDALSVNAQTIDRRNDFFNKSPNIAKIKKQNTNENSKELSGAFNPSKTFGGNKTKPFIFPIKDEADEGKEQVINNLREKNDSFKEDRMLSTQSMMPTLERLFKCFNENQQKLSRIENAESFREVKNFIT